MTLEMRRKLAREPFEEKIKKVSQLLCLVKSFPCRQARAKSKGFVKKGAEVYAKA
jgi:hypothetical protein